MNKKIFISAMILASLASYSAEADTFRNSIAKLNIEGVGEMVVSMLKNKEGNWVLKSSLDGGTIIQRNEEEVFMLDEDGIKPLNYKYSQRILFKKRKEEADFNWSSRTVHFQRGKEEGFDTLEPGTLGPNTAQLQLRLDFKELNLNTLPKELIYVVYYRGKVKERKYKILGQETVKTPMGNFVTYKVDRVFSDGENRSQTFWLAPKLDFSVVRILNVDGRETDIRIKSFEEIAD
mgnify:FL=1|jgi:hypothetical protein